MKQNKLKLNLLKMLCNYDFLLNKKITKHSLNYLKSSLTGQTINYQLFDEQYLLTEIQQFVRLYLFLNQKSLLTVKIYNENIFFLDLIAHMGKGLNNMEVFSKLTRAMFQRPFNTQPVAFLSLNKVYTPKLLHKLLLKRIYTCTSMVMVKNSPTLGVYYITGLINNYKKVVFIGLLLIKILQNYAITTKI